MPKPIVKKIIMLLIISAMIILVSSLAGCTEPLPEPLIPIPPS